MKKSKEYQEIVQLQKIVQTGNATRAGIYRYQFLKWKALSLDELVDFFLDVLDRSVEEVKEIINTNNVKRLNQAINGR